ncbi:epidermal differentiation-specific protein-like [Hypanus sabinus]|uniref:epidermal differentiation-specific protein-like n=1 Tax=Hypanus sabinus TaxID=79690 RepID=UPI0028C42A53|nr:epidermal differentiation-specific protein-like [Hypanus sabinus]
MSKIILYENPDFTGKQKEFVNDVQDLAVENFTNAVRSIRVIGRHWVVYDGTNFKGDFKVFGPGDHGKLDYLDRAISSLRLVKENLLNPEIVLCEHVDYGGMTRSIKETTDDLSKSGFDNLVSSHKVKEGVWILYQDLNQKGPRLITFQGDEWTDYRQFGWNDKLSSVKALLKSDFEV